MELVRYLREICGRYRNPEIPIKEFSRQPPHESDRRREVSICQIELGISSFDGDDVIA